MRLVSIDGKRVHGEKFLEVNGSTFQTRYVSPEQYSGLKWPPYAAGPSYLMTSRAILALARNTFRVSLNQVSSFIFQNLEGRWNRSKTLS